MKDIYEIASLCNWLSSQQLWKLIEILKDKKADEEEWEFFADCVKDLRSERTLSQLSKATWIPTI